MNCLARLLGIFLICMLVYALFLSSLLFHFDIWTDANPFATVLRPVIVLIGGGVAFLWYRSRRNSNRRQSKEDLNRLPQLLDQISANLAAAENGLSQRGYPPAVAALQEIKNSNRLAAETLIIIRKNGSKSEAKIAKLYLSNVVIDEENVRVFLKGKSSTDDISGIDRFTKPARDALSQLQLQLL